MLRQIRTVHPITWVAIFIVALSHALLNLRGAFEPESHLYCHGWPFVWLRGVHEFQLKSISNDMYVWPFRPDRLIQFNFAALLADITIAIAAILAAAYVCEWLMARVHVARKITIGKMLSTLILTAFAIFFLRVCNPGLYPGFRYSPFNIILTAPAAGSIACLAFVSIRSLYLLFKKMVARRKSAI